MVLHIGPVGEVRRIENELLLLLRGTPFFPYIQGGKDVEPGDPGGTLVHGKRYLIEMGYLQVPVDKIVRLRPRMEGGEQVVEEEGEFSRVPEIGIPFAVILDVRDGSVPPSAVPLCPGGRGTQAAAA